MKIVDGSIGFVVRVCCAVGLAWGVAACGDVSGSVDTADAAVSGIDAAEPDAAMPDAAMPDAAMPDAEPMGGCVNNDDCESGLCTDNVCQTTRAVSCADNAPANSTSTVVDVEITFTSGSGWSAPAECAWTCDANYFQDGDTCINSRMVACADVAPANAASIVAEVEITYTDAGGWTEPSACAWACVADYFQDGDTCINERQVDCLDLEPAHGTSTIALVTIVYTDAGGWSEPAACDFTCEVSFCKSGTTCAYADFEFSASISPGSSYFGGDATPSKRNVGQGQGLRLPYPMPMGVFAFNFTGPFRIESGPPVAVTLRLELRNIDGDVLKAVDLDVPDTFSGGWLDFPLDYALAADTDYVFTVWMPTGYDQGASSGVRADVSGAYADGLRYAALDTAGASFTDWTQWFASGAETWNLWFRVRATSACDG